MCFNVWSTEIVLNKKINKPYFFLLFNRPSTNAQKPFTSAMLLNAIAMWSSCCNNDPSSKGLASMLLQ